MVWFGFLFDYLGFWCRGLGCLGRSFEVGCCRFAGLCIVWRWNWCLICLFCCWTCCLDFGCLFVLCCDCLVADFYLLWFMCYMWFACFVFFVFVIELCYMFCDLNFWSVFVCGFNCNWGWFKLVALIYLCLMGVFVYCVCMNYLKLKLWDGLYVCIYALL